MQDKDLLSIGETAEIMNISIDTLRRLDKSGKLSPFRSSGGHRLYSQTQIKFHSNNLVILARDWALNGKTFPEKFYSPDSAVFQARLGRMQNSLNEEKELKNPSLIGLVAGEIGINSYDHNIGNWPDLPGTFFGYDFDEGVIVLADRGQGILTTLKRAKPELNNDKEALRVAFSEIVSGRAPESRGNGLKLVREVIGKNPMGLMFQSGNAVLTLTKDAGELKIDASPDNLMGCMALITF